MIINKTTSKKYYEEIIDFYKYQRKYFGYIEIDNLKLQRIKIVSK